MATRHIDANGLPLIYTAIRQGCPVVSSDLLSLLVDLKWVTVDWEQVFTFVYLGQMLRNRTLFREVKMLPCGTDWFPSFKHRELRKSVKTFTDILVEVIRQEWEAAEHPILSLSAGKDSRLILAVLLALGKRPCVGSFGDWRRSRLHVDNEVSRSIADTLGLSYVFGDQVNSYVGMSEKSLLACGGFGRHSYSYWEAWRSHTWRLGFDMAMTGVGAEIFSGVWYKHPVSCLRASLAQQWRARIDGRSCPISTDSAHNAFNSFIADALTDTFTEMSSDLSPHEVRDFISFRSRSQEKWRCRHALSAQWPKTVHPFANQQVMEASFAIPSSGKTGNVLHTSIIEKMQPGLLRWPFSRKMKQPGLIRRALWKLRLYRSTVADTADWSRVTWPVSPHIVDQLSDVIGGVSSFDMWKRLPGPRQFRLQSVLLLMSYLMDKGVQLKGA